VRLPVSRLLAASLAAAGCASRRAAYPVGAIAGTYSCCFESGFLRACPAAGAPADARGVFYYVYPEGPLYERYRPLQLERWLRGERGEPEAFAVVVGELSSPSNVGGGYGHGGLGQRLLRVREVLELRPAKAGDCERWARRGRG
jgi:hypothetical protein